MSADSKLSIVELDVAWRQPLLHDSQFPKMLGMPKSTWDAVKKTHDIRPIVIGKRIFHSPAEVAAKLLNGRRRGAP